MEKTFQMDLPLFFPRKLRLTDKQFLIWMSAWLDTEGCICMSGKRGFSQKVSIQIDQKDALPLRIIQEKMGGTLRIRKSHGYGGETTGFRWSMHGRAAVRLLCKIANYLVVKKTKAINVIQYYELKENKKADKQTNEHYRYLINDQKRSWIKNTKKENVLIDPMASQSS